MIFHQLSDSVWDLGGDLGKVGGGGPREKEENEGLEGV